MKVTGIETFLCNAVRTNWVFVKVITDTGPTGYAEATLEMREKTVQTAIQELERYLVGRDPHNIEAFVHDAYRDAYWRGGPVLMSALAGVETALWDIKGKDLGVPVYQLLGGKVRDEIPCYANGWFAGAKEPEEFAEKADIAAGMGFKALKWDPFGSAWLNLSRAEFEKALKCVAAVKDAVNGRADLMIEGHGRFNIPTAIRVGHALEDFDVLWFEEPLPPDNLKGLVEVKNRINIPVAAGERLYSRWEYREFFDLHCADFVQADVTHAGGIMEMRNIATMAETRHIPFCPHNPSGPLANAATLQLAACVPNFYLLETMCFDVPYRSEICTEDVDLKNGMMKIPDLPGLGVEINEEGIKNYPYEVHNLRHYTGALTDIQDDEAVVLGGKETK